MDKLSKSSILCNHLGIVKRYGIYNHLKSYKSRGNYLRVKIIHEKIDFVHIPKAALLNLRTLHTTSQALGVDGRIYKVLPTMGCSCIKRRAYVS